MQEIKIPEIGQELKSLGVEGPASQQALNQLKTLADHVNTTGIAPGSKKMLLAYNVRNILEGYAKDPNNKANLDRVSGNVSALLDGGESKGQDYSKMYESDKPEKKTGEKPKKVEKEGVSAQPKAPALKQTSAPAEDPVVKPAPAKVQAEVQTQPHTEAQAPASKVAPAPQSVSAPASAPAEKTAYVKATEGFKFEPTKESFDLWMRNVPEGMPTPIEMTKDRSKFELGRQLKGKQAMEFFDKTQFEDARVMASKYGVVKL